MDPGVLSRLLEGLRNGENGGLVEIFRSNAASCIKGLVKRHNCPREDAEDIYIESVLNFRSKLLDGKIEYITDIGSYLFATCNNMYLAQLKRNERTLRAVKEIEHLDRNFNYDEEGADATFKDDLLLLTETALNNLQDRCRQILRLFYFDRLSLDEIAVQFKMANANVAKVSKARCFQKLVSNVKEIQQEKSLEKNATDR